jgi:hypothetical protein
MSSKHVHKKPIGQSGPVRVSHDVDGTTTIEWQKIEYPPEKKDQELAVATSFVSALNATQASEWSLTPLKEDDFDFELNKAGGGRYLELQEVVIPGKKRGPPYAKGEQVIQPGKFAKTILSAITSKAIKYPSTLSRPLDLLIYTTHWRFVPNRSVLQLVSDGLHKSSHPFANVYFFNRLNETESQTVNLFPSKDLLEGFDRKEAESRAFVNFDPGSGEAFRDGDKVGVRFALSPQVVKTLGKS